MASLRAKERKRQLVKDAQQLARTNIFGPGIVFNGSNVLAQLWTAGMDARLAQLGNSAPIEQQEGLSGDLNDQFGQGEQDPFRDENGEMPFFDGDQTGFPDQMLDGDANVPRRSDDFWDAEIGRAGMDSQPVEMPWARRSTLLPGVDDTTLAGETTLGMNTRSFDIETPSGIRRISRRSDLSLGTTDHRRTTGNAGDAGNAGERFQLGGEEGEAPEHLSSQAMAEQENVQFLDYIAATRAGLKDDDMLLFSDLAPVSDAQVSKQDESCNPSIILMNTDVFPCLYHSLRLLLVLFTKFYLLSLHVDYRQNKMFLMERLCSTLFDLHAMWQSKGIKISVVFLLVHFCLMKLKSCWMKLANVLFSN